MLSSKASVVSFVLAIMAVTLNADQDCPEKPINTSTIPPPPPKDPASFPPANPGSSNGPASFSSANPGSSNGPASFPSYPAGGTPAPRQALVSSYPYNNVYYSSPSSSVKPLPYGGASFPSSPSYSSSSSPSSSWSSSSPSSTSSSSSRLPPPSSDANQPFFIIAQGSAADPNACFQPADPSSGQSHIIISTDCNQPWSQFRFNSLGSLIHVQSNKCVCPPPGQSDYIQGAPLFIGDCCRLDASIWRKSEGGLYQDTSKVYWSVAKDNACATAQPNPPNPSWTPQLQLQPLN